MGFIKKVSKKKRKTMLCRSWCYKEQKRENPGEWPRGAACALFLKKKKPKKMVQKSGHGIKNAVKVTKKRRLWFFFIRKESQQKKKRKREVPLGITVQQEPLEPMHACHFERLTPTTGAVSTSRFYWIFCHSCSRGYLAAHESTKN